MAIIPKTSGQPLGCEYVIDAVDRYGFSVFPVDGEIKKPLLTDWPRRATCSRGRIRRQHDYFWKALGYEPYWGVAPGLSGILPVDVDVKNGKLGQQTYDWFEIEYGWPPTLMSRSPSSGGFHCWYYGPRLLSQGRSSSPHPGIDFAPYLVLPGGPPRKKDGRRYEWINDLPIATAPSFPYEIVEAWRSSRRRPVRPRESKPRQSKSRLVSSSGILGPVADDVPVIALDQPRTIERAKHYLQADAPPSHEGDGGEFAVFLVAAQLKDFGISYPVACDLMDEIYNNEAHCKPPWHNPAQFHAKIANGFRYARDLAPGEDSAEFDFGGEDELDPSDFVSDLSAAELRCQAEAARVVQRGRSLGPPKEILPGGYVKTGKYVTRGGRRIPVVRKVK